VEGCNAVQEFLFCYIVFRVVLSLDYSGRTKTVKYNEDETSWERSTNDSLSTLEFARI